MPSSRAGCTATTPAAATTVTSCGAAPLTLCSTPTDDRGPKGFTATSTRDQEALGGRHHPELLEEPEGVPHLPRLGDASVRHPVDAHGVDRDLLAGRRDAVHLAHVGACARPPDDHPV